MCLLLIAVEAHPEYRLILAGNRDEFYERPTAPAAWWENGSGILAGKDLRAGGTWLGVTRTGRVAALTNYRDPSLMLPDSPSRGELVTGFLKARSSPGEHLEALSERASGYNGFNLVAGDERGIFWYSNRGGEVRRLGPGIHGLSNHLLDTPWPKVEKSKHALRRILEAGKDLDPEALFSMMRDESLAPDNALPDTGVGLEWERILSAIFIRSPEYGTRSTTLFFLDRRGVATFYERTYDKDPDHPSTVHQTFTITSDPGLFTGKG